MWKRKVLIVAGVCGTVWSMCEVGKRAGAVFVIHNDKLYDVATGELRTLADLRHYVTTGPIMEDV